MTMLVTGVGGFIGNAVALKLLERGEKIVGIDNFNDYYDPQLKFARNARLERFSNYSLAQIDIAHQEALLDVFSKTKPDYVFHLAAQAGVRYSLVNPSAYVNSNLLGFANLLECCKLFKPKHLLSASTSSVYGEQPVTPFVEDMIVARPESFYAATKLSNESLAFSYSRLFDLSVSMLRFFTVYGPWGRPDMALYSFTKAILNDETIEIYNHGKLSRDFTYIDDIVDGVVALADSSLPWHLNVPFDIYNIGRGKPVELMDFVKSLELALNKEARKKFVDHQPGDVTRTWANIDKLAHKCGYEPTTDIEVGVENFVNWYRKSNFQKI